MVSNTLVPTDLVRLSRLSQKWRRTLINGRLSVIIDNVVKIALPAAFAIILRVTMAAVGVKLFLLFQGALPLSDQHYRAFLVQGH